MKYCDNSRYKEIEEQMAYRLAIEEAIAKACCLFITSEEPDFNELLQILGEIVSVDRTYIFIFKEKSLYVDNTHEWCAGMVQPQISFLQNIDMELYPWFMQKLKNDKKIAVYDVENLPPEAAGEQAIFQFQNIKSVLIVPIYSSKAHLLGYMGFDDIHNKRKWLDENTKLLNIVAKLIASYWERKKAELSLLKSKEHFRRLAEVVPAPVFLIQNNRFIFVNSAFEKVTEYKQDQLLNMNPLKLIHPEYSDIAKNNHLQCLLKEQIIQYETIIISKNGKKLCIDVSINSMEFKDALAIIGVGYDITFSRENQKQIEIQNRELQQGYAKIESLNRQLTEYQNILIEINKKLETSEERLELALWGAEEGLWDLDLKANKFFTNEYYAHMLGFELHEVSEKTDSWKAMVHPDDIEDVEEKLQAHFSGKTDHYEAEYRIRNKKGNYIWILARGKVVARDKNNNPLRATGLHLDISKKKENEEKISYLSYNDSLTGVHNRAFFDEALHQLDVPRQLPLSIIMGDLNGLKLVNDAFGHHEGDKLLISISKILKSACRSEDIIARWGGDEFVILLPQTKQESVHNICKRIRKLCHEAEANPIQPSIALGSATKVDADQSIFDILGKAEDNMYRNKLLENKSIRNSIISSLQATLHERTHETREHANRLRKLALRFGSSIALPDNELDRLALLAELHDIGKIGIPDDILNKPGPLDKEEWQIIKTHPEIGYRIINSAYDLTAIANEILAHHERWDGSGYPKGLLGEDIPLLSRILSILDTYDVMTHERPYKKARSHNEAIAEIKKCSASQFDPRLVEVFLKVFDNDKY